MRKYFQLLITVLTTCLPAAKLSAVPAWFVVDTMQTNCYNTSGITNAPVLGQGFYGQDGQVFGNQSSFTLSGVGNETTKEIREQNTGVIKIGAVNDDAGLQEDDFHPSVHRVAQSVHRIERAFPAPAVTILD